MVSPPLYVSVKNFFLAFSDEMKEFVEQNNNLYPPSFLSTEEDLDIGKVFLAIKFSNHSMKVSLKVSLKTIVKVTVHYMFLVTQLLSIQNF